MKEADIKKVVRKAYAKVATQEGSCCGPAGVGGDTASVDIIGKAIGYAEEELKEVPDGANLGVGCGNPVALASLKEGETVLDLGSGAGFDCFLAAKRVGEKGKVIGVDFTSEMVEKARENAAKGTYKNVELRLGDIEDLPVADNSVDVVISNCVINLVPDKGRVFREAFRVLNPGGRLAVSDTLRVKELPDSVKNSFGAYVECLTGAIMKDDYMKAIREAGFENIEIADETPFPDDLVFEDQLAEVIVGDLKVTLEELREAAHSVVSAKIQAVKPDRTA